VKERLSFKVLKRKADDVLMPLVMLDLSVGLSQTPHQLRCAEVVGCFSNASHVREEVPATLGFTTRERGEGFKSPGWPVNRLVCCFLRAKFWIGVQPDICCV